MPLRPEGYRFKAAFPEASLLVEEADVRMAGVNVGKVKGKELAADGRRTIAEIEIDPRFAPIKRDTRAILRQKSLLGETYVELAPGDAEGARPPRRGPPARRAGRRTRSSSTRSSAIFDEPHPQRTSRPGCTSRASPPRAPTRATSTTRSATPPRSSRRGADLLRPLAAQELALRRLVRNTGRVLRRHLRAQRRSCAA